MTIDNREVVDEFKQSQSQGSASQLGGVPGAADRDPEGGNSEIGGYGNDQGPADLQDQADLQGQPGDYERPVTRDLSRGERFDMEQGGGRAADAVGAESELTEDEQERAARGQRWIDEQATNADDRQP